MKTITSKEFGEVATGNSLLFFFRQKGCSNCDTTKPVIESMNKDGLKVFGFDADTERPLIDKYGPKKQNWNLPLLVYMENGKVVNTLTGLHSEEEILEMTKTLRNISDIELQGIYLELDIKRAQIKKESFDVDMSLLGVVEEMKRREDERASKDATPTPPEETKTQESESGMTAIAKELIENAKPSSINTHLVTKKSNDLDLSGFPEGQSPDDESCEGCGSDKQ